MGGVDLYCTNKPCYGQNVSANPYLYAAEMTRIIRKSAKNASNNFFIFLSLHAVHQPVESPLEFVNLYNADNYNSTNEARRIYNGMHSGIDYVVKNTSDELAAANLWNNTIFILFGDNGGTFEHGMPVPGSSNYPLRGHKYSFFEGGIRVAAFIYSPLLPATVRGTTNHALLHVSDWWPTVVSLAGLQPVDNCTGCVPIDGLDIWPNIISPDLPSPRNELLIGIGSAKGTKGAIIQGDYKLIAPGGNAVAADGWSAQYPGSTYAIPASKNSSCQRLPCLFNLKNDPRETIDLVDIEPLKVSQMLHRYQVLAKALYAPNGDEKHAVAPDNCDHDNCWESGLLWSRRLNDISNVKDSVCNPNGTWYDGNDIFTLVVIDKAAVMNIHSGCQNCAFTIAKGTVKGNHINLTAFGKGSFVRHEGSILSSQPCRIHWNYQNRTSPSQWSDFCKNRRCESNHDNDACKAMLIDGYWKPWMPSLKS